MLFVNQSVIITADQTMGSYNNKMENLTEILTQCGLGEKGAKIYLALLEFKIAAISTVAKKTNLPRSTTYNVLKELLKKGLVSESQKKGISYFAAADPRLVVDRAQEAWQRAQTAAPQLLAISQKYQNYPYATFYEGYEGIKSSWRDSIRTPDKEILAYGSIKDIYDYYHDFNQWFIKERVKKKVSVREIGDFCDASFQEKKDSEKELRQVKILPPEIKLNGFTIIYDDKVVIASFKHETAIVIQDREHADTQRQLFELMWQQLK